MEGNGRREGGIRNRGGRRMEERGRGRGGRRNEYGVSNNGHCRPKSAGKI